jgi:hypothetical protein
VTRFIWSSRGDTSDVNTGIYSITTAQLIAWNPPAGPLYNGLWVNTYACASIIGVELPETTTHLNNGLATPKPIQAGMVPNRNKFYLVENGQTCAVIAAMYLISTVQFIQWNPASKNDCSGLWGSAVSRLLHLIAQLPSGKYWFRIVQY